MTVIRTVEIEKQVREDVDARDQEERERQIRRAVARRQWVESKPERGKSASATSATESSIAATGKRNWEDTARKSPNA
jgi:hypothetical protein